jgi:enterochelin esterase-like enzyme
MFACRPFLIGIVALFVARPLVAQSPPDPNYVRQQVFASYADFKAELAAISATTDATARTARLNTLWGNLRNAGQAPYAQGDQVAFLYRGGATSVSFPGDANGWSGTAYRATQVAGTDLWMYETRLPTDARVDYKIITGGSTWNLDPANPLQMWSGFGPNSELRMPAYEYPHETIRRANVARGTLGANVRVSSAQLGYDVNYRVYKPAGYDQQALANLPVVYVTDGHEYSADHMGSLVAVLDNLIDDGSLRPTLAVFVDPRDPNNSANNRRASELVLNPKYANFVADELRVAIDGAFRTSQSADDRMILGTSLGGLNSAYFGATKSSVFHKIGIQSPAFSAGSSIYDMYRKAPTAPLEIFMTAGTINDGNGGPTMQAILQQFGYDYTYTTANEGHSWGNWRGQLSEMLIELIGPPQPGDFNGDGQVNAADYTRWRDGLGAIFTAADYQTWVSNFQGTASAAVAVPEPSAVILAGMIGIVGAARRFCVFLRRTVG